MSKIKETLRELAKQLFEPQSGMAEKKLEEMDAEEVVRTLIEMGDLWGPPAIKILNIVDRDNQILLKLLENTNPKTRINALYHLTFLERVGDKGLTAIEKLLEEDKNPAVRAEAVLCLAYVPSTRTIPPIIKRLHEDTDGKVRCVAAETLGDKLRIAKSLFNRKAGESYIQELEKYIPDLLKVFYEDDTLIARAGAARSLAEFEVKEIIEAIKDNLKKEGLTKETEFLFAVALVKLEGKEGVGTKTIEKMINEKKLTDSQIGYYKDLCRELNLEEKLEAVKEAAAASGMDSLVMKVEALERAIQDEKEEREYLKRFTKSTYERFDKIIKEQDFFLGEERKEGLEKQIEILERQITSSEKRVNESINKLEAKVDKELRTKNVLEGAWKATVIMGAVLSAIATIATIVLIVLKIIEAIPK